MRRMQRSTMSFTSSGSLRSEKFVKPERSAKSTVSTRRSSASAAAAVPAPAASRAEPHEPQNWNAAGFSSPQ